MRLWWMGWLEEERCVVVYGMDDDDGKRGNYTVNCFYLVAFSTAISSSLTYCVAVMVWLLMCNGHASRSVDGSVDGVV